MPLRVSLASLVASLALVACSGDESASRPSLSRTDPGAPAKVCPAGGSTVSHGLDDDEDGVLDDAEIDGREYVCQDAPAPVGELVGASAEEPPGENCEHGGTRIDSGLDDDGDGTLDASEIDRSDYVCREAEGPAELTTVEVEPAGANCELGGAIVHTGPDTDGDGTLDAEEITATSYVCETTPPVIPPAQLTTVEVEPAGANCEFGGAVVHRGPDTDGDGTLDGEEIAITSYVCDPTPPQTGPALLTAVELEPAGAHCEFGGAVVRGGADLDGDATLDPDEVLTTSYLCDAPPPPGAPPVLSELAIEPAGAHCVAGGSVMHTGHDDDRDGTLDATEIESSEYVCSGVLAGDYFIDSPQAAEALAGVQVITGNLSIDPVDFADGYDIVLPDLRIVGGDVLMDEPARLDSFAAPELTRIGGDLIVNSLRVDGLVLPELTRVDGYLFVAADKLEELRLPALRQVGYILHLRTRGHVLDLGSLHTVANRLFVDTRVETLVLPELTHVGSLDLAGFTREISAPELRYVDGDLDLDSDLESINLPRLVLVGGELKLNLLPHMTALSLPGLERVGGRLLVNILQELTTIDLPRLRTVGTLMLTNLRDLASVDLPALEEIGDLTLQWNDGLTSFTAAKLRHAGSLHLSHLPLLKDLGLAALEEIDGTLHVKNCGSLVDFTGFTGLTEARNLEIAVNDGLVHLGFPALRIVHETIEIGRSPLGNAALERVDFPALVFTDGLIIQGNDVLTQLELPRLGQIGSAFWAFYNPKLAQCVVDAFHDGLAHQPAEYDTYHNDGVCPL